MEGDPFPVVYWLKNGTNSIPRAHLSADNRTLVIHDVDISEDGVYTCVTMNRAGNHSSSAIVGVLSKHLLTIQSNLHLVIYYIFLVYLVTAVDLQSVVTWLPILIANC